jgi:hypothetical protein
MQEFFQLDFTDKEVKFRPLSIYQCPKCGYHVPVQTAHIDWEKACRELEDVIKKMNEQFDRMTKEAGEAFDVPLYEYWAAQKLELMQYLRELQERLKDKGI